MRWPDPRLLAGMGGSDLLFKTRLELFAFFAELTRATNERPRIPLTQFPCHPFPASFDKRFGQGNGDTGIWRKQLLASRVQLYARERWIDYLVPCRFGRFNEGFSSQIGF